MASSNTEIANFALSLMGESAVLNLSDSPVMALRYDSIRDAVLRAHPWNFAVKRAVLAQLVEVPAFGFSTAFALPADFLRVVRVNESSEPSLYKVELQGTSKVILANASTVELLYVSRVISETMFDPLFVETLAARLAADTAYTITRDWVITTRLWTYYAEKLAEARSIDSMEDPTQHIEADDFIEARVGLSSFRPIGG